MTGELAAEGKRANFQFGTAPWPEDVDQPKEPEALTLVYSLTHEEAAEVMAWAEHLMTEGCGEGDRVGPFESETVAHAVLDLINVAPQGLVALYVRAMPDEDDE
jgi:hypothetical protein